MKVLADNNEFSLTLLRGTQLVDEAARRHQASPTAAAALGRALMGGVLLTAFRGEGEGVAVRFRGTGPLGQVVVVAEHPAAGAWTRSVGPRRAAHIEPVPRRSAAAPT